MFIGRTAILILLVIFLLGFSQFSHADQWAKTYGGSRGDRASSIRQTSDGGYIVAGQTNSFGTGGYDVWVLKLDSSGNVSWQETYSGSSYDVARSIQQTSDGGYIVAGHTESFGVCGIEAWVLKLDRSGNDSWQKTYGGSSSDSASSIQQTSDGGYIVAGNTHSFGAGGADVWVLKLDGSGNVSWQKTYGGSDWDFANSIGQTSDGGYIVAAQTYSFGAGFDDVWVLKLDGSGNVSWQKTYGGIDYDYANSIGQTSDGGYIVAGHTESFGAGDHDAWVLKLDSNGNITWQKTYGGVSVDYADSIQQTSDGGYIVEGVTESFGAGVYDVWILKLDSNGNITWQKTYGGVSVDYADSIQQTSDGGYIVSGDTASFDVGGGDAWILKFNALGDIIDCSAEGTSTAVVNNTGVTGANTNVTAAVSTVSPVPSTATTATTNAAETEVCYYQYPVPDIKANGSDGPVTITQSDNLSVTAALDDGDMSGDNADWWVVADTPFGWYYYNLVSGWLPGMKVTYQGPLFDLSAYEVLNMSGLPTGSYTFYFGVDMLMNGSLDMGQIYYDSVGVNVTQ